MGVRGLARALAFACFAAAAFAAPAAAAPIFGVAEDSTKFADDGGAGTYGKMRAIGMTENRMTVYFDPTQPTTIQEQAFLDRSVPVAASFGVRIVFAVYGITARAFETDTDTRIRLYAEYLRLVARRYPQVRHYVLLNEPNEAFFFQPQFGPDGKVASAGLAFRILAAGYDALKSVSAGITVIGLGLSAEANDRTSVSPVRFIKALGDAYRASGRTTPIMDEFGMHIHARDSTQFNETTAYQWPNVGPANLDRIKQAVWDAFSGTGQPTFGENGSGAGLRFKLAEVGVQVGVIPSVASLYHNVENVRVTDEAGQADIYARLIRALGCDPNVAELLLFLMTDQADLTRFQSGLLRVDGTERPAYGAVRDAIAQADRCSAPPAWRHTTEVLGAKATFDAGDKPATQRVFGFSATATEDAVAKAGLFRVGGPRESPSAADVARALASAGAAVPVKTTTKDVRAYFNPRFEFQGELAPGYYVAAVLLRAAVNPSRTTLLRGPVFKVGEPGLVPRSVSLRFVHSRQAGGLTVFGRVGAGNVECLRTGVVVERAEGDTWKTVKKTSTNRRGRYSTTVADEAGRYRVSLARETLDELDELTCTAASKSKEHRHRV